MIEATRRRSPALSGSAMRRLMTRPIHAHLAGTVPPRALVAEVPSDIATDAHADAPMAAPALPNSETGSADADLARLRLEVAVMKAALAAERRESEALRSSLGLVDAETLGEEARAVRARWAALVERLIHDAP
ncbi:hypothetical protein MPPM_2140 [Methylorubrum populi]|uniref:Uncharacterized protein n=1 Tax=Methylorubrum populi TaxID=223967 RepID=A0A160PE67_9HYPH|nr:hypothetical protein [Methylorubrum populi]BAU90745.1 hypothetical protein MPPM_2140 [Methylorubrum populi]